MVPVWTTAVRNSSSLSDKLNLLYVMHHTFLSVPSERPKPIRVNVFTVEFESALEEQFIAIAKK